MRKFVHKHIHTYVRTFRRSSLIVLSRGIMIPQRDFLTTTLLIRMSLYDNMSHGHTHTYVHMYITISSVITTTWL